MFVIATAGHVDHGKSTLVRALTGINPDRLREEQEREMTIDLGFAWMTLPNGESVGIVDVPGHIDFIENMLAGVGGVHAALLVIAADEGPMPQTREHLAILDLLRVPRAVVALTKADLAPDAEWLDLVSADIRRLLAPTTLAGAPIVPVSARTGQGLPALIAAILETRLFEAQDSAPESGFLMGRDRGRARLPVDRVFSIAGFGTVATGTLADGSFAIGDEVEILPQGIRARVRGLQTHKQKLERVQPGSRVAMNLTGVSVEQVARGSVVAKPGILRSSTLLDVQLDLLAAPFLRAALRHNSEIKFFSGTAESVARARLLDGDELAPGAQGWAQLELARPVVVAPGDRFIARLPSPSVTIGGGVVVDPHPAQRHRRCAGRADEAVLARLSALLQGTPAERLESTLRRLGFTSRAEAAKQSGLIVEEFEAAFGELSASGALLQVDDVVALTGLWRARLDALAELLAAFHVAQPLAAGMPRESARSKLQLAPRIFNALVHYGSSAGAEAGVVVDEGEVVRAPSHQVRFNAEQQRAVDGLLAQCRAQPFNTPSVKECRATVGDAVYEVLLRQGQLVQVSPEVVFLRETYETSVQRIRELIQQNTQITAAQVRDAFTTTRKYALALLEHLDAQNITRRVGDARVLGK